MLNHARKLAILLLFHTCWGIALGWSISKYGLGVSTDATSYMFAGVNWITGKGLVDFQGAPYRFWPPFYPMLIGFLHLTGASAFGAAHIIQFAAFIVLAWCSSIFFLKLFPDDFGFALLGTFLFDTGVVVVSNFDLVGTDYLFTLFPLVFALLLKKYEENQQWVALTLMGLTASLAMLTRYLGYALVLTALISVFYYTRGPALKRTLRAVYVGLFSLSPLLWMLATWQASNGIRRAPLTFGEYAAQFTDGMIGWFTAQPPHFRDLALWDYALVWGPVLLAVILLFTPPIKRRVSSSPLIWSTLGFGGIYTVMLFTSALVAYFNRLWGRFQLPIYLPLIVLFLVVIQHGLQYLKQKSPHGYYAAAALGFTFLAAASLMQFRVSASLLQYARTGDILENSINTREANENSILRYWNEHPPQGDFLLFSNYAALAAFHTQHEALPSPRKSGLYDTTIIPLTTYVNELFGAGKDVYLLWVEPNPRELAYTPKDLAEIAEIQVILENKDGGIYLLRLIH